MPNMAPVVLSDTNDPAVSHTFKPKGQNAGVTTYVESTGIPLGDRRITVSQVSNANGCIRTTIKLAFPVLQNVVVDGVNRPNVIRTNYVDVVLNMDATSSTRERDDMRYFMAQLLGAGIAFTGDNGQFSAVIRDNEGLY